MFISQHEYGLEMQLRLLLRLARDAPVDRKHRAYPELRRCGRVSRGTLAYWTFLPLVARARAGQRHQRPPWCAAAARQTLNQHWKTHAAFAALRAHACSLLERPIAAPSDPSHDWRWVRLAPSWLARQSHSSP